MLRLIIGTVLLIGCAAGDATTRSTPASPATTGHADSRPLASGTHRIAVDGGDLVDHVHGREEPALFVEAVRSFAAEAPR